eukprot:2508513-Karenia_brevis.AAC.1
MNNLKACCVDGKPTPHGKHLKTSEGASSAKGKRHASPDVFPAKQAAWIQAGVGHALEAFA